MIYRFEDCELDVAAHELRRGGARVPLERQVFEVLKLLLENHERLVSRAELVERVWGGRFVSDAAVDSRIKSLRQALGDDGRTQRLVRTQHGVGFRFIGRLDAPSIAVATSLDFARVAGSRTARRPSIAVLPFVRRGDGATYNAIADGLPHELIVELSRLRWLLVIARGSSFRFRDPYTSPAAAGEALRVGYCLSGSVEFDDAGLVVTVELCETAAGAVLWSERYRRRLGDVHDIRREIAAAVVSALDLQIPLAESQRALQAPQNLDAWATYHLALGHLYQFDRSGAQTAAELFARAAMLEPGFARAYAGLSFAHFEYAFLHFGGDRDGAAQSARRFAERSLQLDPLDPFCNLVMGRAAWLTGDLEAALPWLDRAIELNPNYAQAKYSSAWTRTLIGDGTDGQVLVDAALELSPFDPLLYGMFGVRALSHIVLDDPSGAALWGERAARAPRAHQLIELIAAVGHGLNGDRAKAATWAASARARQAGLGVGHFLQAFPFRNSATRAVVEATLERAFG